MNYKQAIQAIKDWEQNNPEKYLAWGWFVKGVKEAECWQYNECGNEEVMPFQKQLVSLVLNMIFGIANNIQTNIIRICLNFFI